VAVLELPDMTSHVYAYYRGLREYYALYLIETDSAKAVASSIDNHCIGCMRARALALSVVLAPSR
jgi:hypothetical protein